MAQVPVPLSAQKPVALAPDLRPTERVAVILSLLDPPQAKAIAAQLDQDMIPDIIEAYQRMRTVPRPTLLKTIATFVTEMRSNAPTVYGGKQRAASLAETIQDEIQHTSEASNENTSDDSAADTGTSLWEDLAAMPSEDLARLMARERPSVIAAILARFPEAIGGAVMRDIPEPIAIAVTAQMAKAGPVSPMTLDAIRESIERAAADDTPGDNEEGQVDPLPRLTAILNRCPVSRQKIVLDALRVDDPSHADAVAARLIRFDGLAPLLPRNAAPMLFREIDEPTLDTAIRFGDTNAPETIEYLYSNISQRLAEQIRERINARRMPSDEEGEQAQAALLSKVLEWVEEGRFELNEPKSNAA